MSHELPTASSEPDFKLGSWWVRPQRNEIEGDDDSVHLEARSMNVLVCLARHAPDVVSKQRLRDAVWADAPYVGDDVIAHAIWELRKAFGDSAKNPAVIQTIPRRGYRLLPEINRPSGSPVPVEGAAIDHYLLGRELGRGSMGVVYEAVDRRLGRTVAVKFLAPELTRDPKSVQRFVREARLAASLEHPNLATVYEVGETSRGHRYLVMAHYAGGSLKDRLIRGPVPVDEAVRLARQLCAGLAAAHARDIIHRDIKPANLLLDEHGTLKIADFGIAKLLGGSDLTRTGAALGTPAYKSPEQSRGEPVDMRTDIWSVGVVLFEMLTGRRPFDGDYEHAVVHAILSRRPRLAEDAFGQPVSKPIRQVVARALAKEPTARFESAEALGEALESASEVGRGSAGRRVPMALWAVLIGVLVVAAWSQLAGHLPSPPGASRPSRAPELEAEEFFRFGKRSWLKGNSTEHLAAASTYFREALEKVPDWGPAMGHLAVLLADRYELFRNEEDLAEARALIARGKILQLEDPILRVAEARLERLNQNCGAAEELSTLALRSFGSTCSPEESCDLAFAWLAEAQWCLERPDEALATLDRCIEASAGEPVRCYIKRAQIHQREGRSHKAVGDYLHVLENVDPDQTTALTDLGVVYIDTGQISQAARRFSQLTLLTRDPGPRFNYGNVLYEQGRYERAKAEYEKAAIQYEASGLISASPAVAAGDALLELGRRDEAREWFAKALVKFDRLLADGPKNVYREGQRAVCKAKLGSIPEARQEIDALRRDHPGNDDLVVFAARIAALAGDRSALFALVEAAIAAGIEPKRLTDDAAFIEFRGDDEYNDRIERAGMAMDGSDSAG